MCAQVRVLQHEKERLERVQQEKQDLENKFYDEMKRYANTLLSLFNYLHLWKNMYSIYAS